MAKYRVVSPVAYSQPTGEPSYRRGKASEEVVHLEPGEIVELDDSLAWMLGRKLEPYIEPPKAPKPQRRIRTTRIGGGAVAYGGSIDVSRDDVATPPQEQSPLETPSEEPQPDA